MADENPENESQESAPAEAAAPALTALLLDTFADSVRSHHSDFGDETVVIRREGMLDVFRFLKDDPRCAMEMMIDLTAVDYLPRDPRFEVVVHLKSLSLHHRLRVKIPIPESACEVDSISALWVAADWYERECWDMYGIDFKGHPDLRRLLMYDEFVGYPLRKDYEYSLQQPLVPLLAVQERHDYHSQVLTSDDRERLES